MLGYHLFIAWKSIRRTPKQSLLLVAGFALGVAVATLFSAIHHTYAQDPVPGGSRALHLVRMDNWDPKHPLPEGIPEKITYRDMAAIMESIIPARQTGSFRTNLVVDPRTEQGRMRVEALRLCHADFFGMFQLPFRYGSAWDRRADEEAAPVVVLSEEVNNQWFGGEDSVGRVVKIDDRDFRVVGVLAHWQPPIRFYDMTLGPIGFHERMYIPLSLTPAMRISKLGGRSWGPISPDFNEKLTQELNFVQMWVELPSPADVSAYEAFLDGYALEQRRIGRFQRPLDNRVTPLLDYMKERGCPPPEATAMMSVANLFLGGCALSLMGLLLTRFVVRSAETGVRRALGARRWDIFVQLVIESEVLALGGGLLGLGLSAIGVWIVNKWFKTMTITHRDDIFRIDLTMVGFAVGVSLVAGLLAGIYPAYRLCRTPPVRHLKSQ